MQAFNFISFHLLLLSLIVLYGGRNSINDRINVENSEVLLETDSFAEKSRLKEFEFKNSKYIDKRKYSIYLPPSYYNDKNKEYPVLYMMDAQVLFGGVSPFGSHSSWNIHKVADSLVKTNTIHEFIIVGINNASEKRFAEYMPQKPLETLPKSIRDSLISLVKFEVYSDDFLKFLVEELKTHIDANFRTKSGAETTFIGGSSMGGLISMYALCEYPKVFGGAMCMSTHWSISLDDSTPVFSIAIINYFLHNLPASKKWYFDFGTVGIDQHYEKYQSQVDNILLEKGYSKNENWLTKKFKGHDHDEKYWNQRLYIPLTFLFHSKL